MYRIIAGNTVRFTWVSSGANPSSIGVNIMTGSETAVSSNTFTSSGGGLYYADVTIPSTPGYYVAEAWSTISTKPYKNRVMFKAVLGEVD